MKKSLVAAFALLTLIACGDNHPSSPAEAEVEHGAPPGLILSNVFAGQPSALKGNVRADVTTGKPVAYISASAGTFPNAVAVAIRNVTQRTTSRTIVLLDGGFDPVAVDASTDDVISITPRSMSGTDLTPMVIKVPAKRPPRVVRTSPSKGGIDIALNVQIEIVFSEPVDANTAKTSIALQRNGASVPMDVTLSDDGLSANIVVSTALEPLAEYSLVVATTLRDLDGDALEEESTTPFTTESASGTLAFANGYGIYGIKSDGGTPVPLAFVSVLDRVGWTRYSPDGSRIAFIHSKRQADIFVYRGDVYVLNLKTGEMSARTTDGNYASVEWSPDGSKLAVSDEGLYQASISIVNADGPIAVNMVTRDGRTPTWSPDGKTIAYIRDSGDDGYNQLMAMNVDGSSVREITAVDPGGIFGLDWSKDNRLAFSKCLSGECGIFSSTVDGGDIVKLAPLSRASPSLEWSTDSRYIAFTDWWSSTTAVGVIGVSGGSISYLASPGSAPTWKP